MNLTLEYIYLDASEISNTDAVGTCAKGLTRMSETNDLSAVELATELTIAWLGNQNTRISADEVPTFLRAMHAAVSELASGGSDASTAEGDAQQSYEPAVSVRKSLASKDHIISMIDGKPYKTLRRHLSRHGLTPEQYRERYNLKPDYPIVSESYSEARRAMAHKIGLGSKGRAAKTATAGAADKPKRGGRAAKSE